MKLGVFFRIFLCVFIAVSIFSFVSTKEVYAQNEGGQNAWQVAQGVVNDIASAPFIPLKIATGAAKKAGVLPDEASIIEGVSGGMQKVIMVSSEGLLRLASKVLSWVGIIFDTAIEETVLNVGDRNHLGAGNEDNYYGLVLNIWKIFRDIANIIVIFSLLYLAIKTILEGNGFADKKTLSSILIAAALINFSLFFTKLAFDASNMVSVAVYSEIKGGEYANSSLTEGIMRIVNLEGMINILHVGSNGDWTATFNLIGQSLLFVTLCVILGVIFVAASLMLIYRFFVFIVLMMVSPLGLVSGFVPWLSSHGKKWWEELRKQSIALPTFFVMLYIALYAAGTIFQNMSDRLKAVPDVFSDQPAASSLTSLGMFLLQFIILSMFLFFALIAPGYVGGAGSGIMSSAGKKLQGFGNRVLRRTAGVPLGAAALTGRTVVGGLGGRLVLKSDKLKAAAQKSGFGGSIARKIVSAADYVGNKATYDARNIKVGGKAIGKEYGLGDGIKGYKAAVDDQKSKAEKQKKREFELLGFKDMKADPQAFAAAKNQKAINDKLVTNAQKYLEDVVKLHGIGSDEANTAQESLKTALKVKKESDEAFGKENNKGESEYAKLNESRAKRYHNRWTTRGAGRRELNKDMGKKWTTDPNKAYRDAMLKMASSVTTPPTT